MKRICSLSLAPETDVKDKAKKKKSKKKKKEKDQLSETVKMDGEQQEGKVKPLDFHTTPSRGQERSELRYATHAPMMIKEVGGAMQSQWKDYIDTCNQLLVSTGGQLTRFCATIHE